MSGVVGSVADRQPVVICGDLFGDLGPDIVLFADMEKGLVGEPVAASAPGFGAWIGGSSLFADDAARSGSMSMLVADADINDGKGLSTTFALPDADGPFG